ncbi:MAG: aminotransferase class V-fold PLP-dependent enzyme [bacterium]
MTWQRHFSRFLGADPGRLHFAAHSHHLWPDVAFDAQQRAWLDAAELVDGKWDRILGEVLPAAQAHVARILGLSDPSTLVFAPNTHEFQIRLLSCFTSRPVRVLTTDSEFHSFERQSRRWDEAGAVELTRVPAEPHATFARRFLAEVARRAHDLVFLSHVHFNSAYVFQELEEVAAAAAPEAFVVVDGYHGFMALPTDLGPIAARAFYLAGGYKYAMSGEGVCFLHCPPGFGPRPTDTGWYAGFGDLEEGVRAGVPYAADARRFWGATFDPSGLYRFVAVQDLWEREGLEVAAIHHHVRARQADFLEALEDLALPELSAEQLVPDRSFAERGHFLTFRLENAGDVHRALRDENVITDHRGDRLRFGFGIYQEEEDVAELGRRLARVFRRAGAR